MYLAGCHRRPLFLEVKNYERGTVVGGGGYIYDSNPFMMGTRNMKYLSVSQFLHCRHETRIHFVHVYIYTCNGK